MTKPSKLTLAFVSKRPVAAARVLETLPTRDAAEFVAAIPVRYAEKLLSPLNSMVCAEIVQALPDDSMIALLREMDFSNAAAALRRFEPDSRAKVLAALPDNRRNAMESVLQFSPGTVGAHMKTGIVIATPDETVKNVLHRLLADKDGACDSVLVVDDQQKLLGSVPLSTMVRQRGGAVMGDLMNVHCTPVSARSRLTQVRDHPAWAHCKQLPVVSRQGDLLGVLYYQDVLTEKNRENVASTSQAPSVVGSLLHLMWGSASDVARLSTTVTPKEKGVSNER